MRIRMYSTRSHTDTFTGRIPYHKRVAHTGLVQRLIPNVGTYEILKRAHTTMRERRTQWRRDAIIKCFPFYLQWKYKCKNLTGSLSRPRWSMACISFSAVPQLLWGNSTNADERGSQLDTKWELLHIFFVHQIQWQRCCVSSLIFILHKIFGLG